MKYIAPLVVIFIVACICIVAKYVETSLVDAFVKGEVGGRKQLANHMILIDKDIQELAECKTDEDRYDKIKSRVNNGTLYKVNDEYLYNFHTNGLFDSRFKLEGNGISYKISVNGIEKSDTGQSHYGGPSVFYSFRKYYNK